MPFLDMLDQIALWVGYAAMVWMVIVAGTITWWAVEHRVRAWQDRGGR